MLHTTQNRLREKTFLRFKGIPTAPFEAIRSLAELRAALARIGAPAVLKTAGFGYDGKGQAVIKHVDDALAAWQAIGEVEAVLEGFIDFEGEVSVVAARGLNGDFAHFGVVENIHRNHILDLSIPDAQLPASLLQEAEDIARTLLEALDVIGVLCVEFFVTRDGRLLVNELAPRPHNSGHFTFDACVSSQFEQQVRAACGLPLGGTDLLRPAAMVNLLGDVWEQGEPNWAAACAEPAVKLHLYGKAEPRPGRKMGHLTAFGADRDEAAKKALAAREALLKR
ncbi:5-(carboxyamino)imidazole ribonucleotide synthase [Alkalilimnicola ehrlichii]|uniref:5-(carboxyamino)imidazole ribonucleotide synthase n=1 Tax=Alkalilimnicola ehrlichii TaxID=351052 RepID=UPI0021615521|nr:5-(carboxyamino)imidazole ribonucleotide synthase [Alkalilimnicola ehrlichii]